MQTPLAGAMHRRGTRDRDTLELAEDLHVGAMGLDRRATRAWRKPRILRVETAIDGVDGEVLSPKHQSLYRAVVARINYLSQDRGDLQFASKECPRKMSCPAQDVFTAVKRFARYLIHAPRAVILYSGKMP